MKRTVLILLAALLTLTLSAQSRYCVYKTKGTVRICPKAENTWTEAARKRQLQLGDHLQLGEQSAVIILDNTNNRLYTYEEPGECTVMEAVRSARDKAGARTAAVNAEMRRSIESHTDATSYGVLGVTYRGQGSVSYTDSLATRLRLLPQSERDSSRLSLALEPVGDAAVFRIRNESEVPLYVNVLRIDGENLTVCLEFEGKEGSEGVLVDAGAEIVLDQYPFVELEGACYLVFGTTRFFDTRSLQRALRRGDGRTDALLTGFVY